MSDMTLEELSARTIVAANTLTLKPGQEAFVAPVSHSIAEAYVNPTTAWPRVVMEDGEVVGFIMGNFDPEAHEEIFAAASGASTSTPTRRATASAGSRCSRSRTRRARAASIG